MLVYFQNTLLVAFSYLLVVQAAPPTFQQVQQLTVDEGTLGTQSVGNFIFNLLDGDNGLDGFTGSIADAQVVNIAPNSDFFTVIPAVTPPARNCDPAPGCSLTLTYQLAQFASGVVTFQIQINDAALEPGPLIQTTLTVREINNAPIPGLATSLGTAGNPVTTAENSGAVIGIQVLAVPIPPGPPRTIQGPAPFGNEAGQIVMSISCVADRPNLFAAMNGPDINPTTGLLSFTPQRGRVGITTISCDVRDSADDPTTTADNGSIQFVIQIIAGQDCADGEVGALACDGTLQTCSDDGLPHGDDLLNNNFVCVCNNGGQTSLRQAAQFCDDCFAGAAGAISCADATIPARWHCVDPDPSPGAQGNFLCNCTNNGGVGTPPATCDDCLVGAIGTFLCGPTAYCIDPDFGDPLQQRNYQCVCNNNANRGTPSANTPPTSCDDCQSAPCGNGQTCMDPDAGLPAQQFNYICTCLNGGGSATGTPATTCNDCSAMPNVCGVGQSCTDTNPGSGSQGDFVCSCDNNNGVTAVGGRVPFCDDCSASPCGDPTQQVCFDPNPISGSYLDFTCTCNNGINYGVLPIGQQVGSIAICPRPPTFTPGVTIIRVSEELSREFLNNGMIWTAGPGIVSGYNRLWATVISDAEGLNGIDSMTQSREFRLRFLSGSSFGSSTNATDMFLPGAPPFVDSSGRLSFNLRHNAWGIATYSVVLVDSGEPSRFTGNQNSICENSDIWCTSARIATLTIEVVPENDPPSFNCTNQTITVFENSGPINLQQWAVNVSAGQFEDANLQGLEFKVYNDNPGLFANQPHVDHDGVSTTADLRFEPLLNAEGEANVVIELWDSGQDVDGSVRRQSATCNTIRIVVLDVNQIPTFSNQGDVTVLEDAPRSTIAKWAREISAGAWDGSRGNQAPNDASRNVWFRLVYQNATKDSRKLRELPTIHPVTGDLTVWPTADENTALPDGPILFNVTLVDSLGRESIIHTLTLHITPIDDPSTFLSGLPRISVLEDSGLYNSTWATQISVGRYEGAQLPAEFIIQTVQVTTNTQNQQLFEGMGPQVDSNGMLTFTPAANQSGEATIAISIVGGTSSSTAVLVINIIPVNDQPYFTLFQDVIFTMKSSGPQTVRSFFNDILPGPVDEYSQSVSLLIQTNNSNLFIEEPRTLYNGGGSADLFFTPSDSLSGVALVTIRGTDNGGVAQGGQNTLTRTFLIVVSDVNNPPTFVKGSDIILLEDACLASAPCNFSNWATRISPGSGEDQFQSLTFIVRPFVDSFLDEIQVIGYPGIDAGRLSISLVPNNSGVSMVTATAIDSMNLTSSPQTFLVTVRPVNDAPSFDTGADIFLDECLTVLPCSYSFPGWVNNVIVGPPDESGQTMTYTVDTNSPNLFSIPPQINPVTGTLTFSLNQYQNSAGVPLSFLITGCDSGGRQNGGQDCVMRSFNLTVGTVNSGSFFQSGAAVVAIEDEGLVLRRNWATNTTTGRTNGQSNIAGQVTCFPNDPSLFSSITPNVNISIPSGDLQFVTAPNQHGVTIVSCNGLVGSNTTLNEKFMVTILPVNDAPTFQLRNLSLALNTTTGTGSGIVLVGNNRTAIFDPNLFWAQGLVIIDQNTTVPFPGVLPGTNRVPGPGGSFGIVQQFNQNYVISGRDVVVLENWGNSPMSGGSGYVIQYLEPSAISAGAPDEDLTQDLTFETVCTNTALFTSPPEVSSSGILVFKLREKLSGNAYCTITLVDNGDTLRGGIRRSAPLTFSIVVLDVNNPPEFTRGPDVVVLEDVYSEQRYRQDWASNINSGDAGVPASEVALRYLENNSTAVSDLSFVVDPFFEPWPTSGVLSFQLGRNEFGTAEGFVFAIDSSGATSERSSLTITVLPVNDAPLFTLKRTIIRSIEDVGRLSIDIIENASPGPTNEAGQLLRWEVTRIPPQSSSSLQSQREIIFAEDPRIIPTTVTDQFNITFLSELDSWGTGRYDICLIDDGGTANGGIDRFCQQIQFEISSVNDPPRAVTSGAIQLKEDSGLTTIRSWISMINPGPQDEILGVGQTGTVSTNNAIVVGAVSCPTTPVLLNSVPTIVYPPGDITIDLIPNYFGQINCTVSIQDSGGSVAVVEIPIEVVPVNDMPQFTGITSLVEVFEDSTAFRSMFATSLSIGHSTEVSSQRYSFLLTPTAARLGVSNGIGDIIRDHTAPVVGDNIGPVDAENQLFVTNPTITLMGQSAYLSFVPAPDQYGEVSYNVQLVDNGGILNGGIDRSVAVPLTVRVLSVNDMPFLASNSTLLSSPPVITILEDQSQSQPNNILQVPAQFTIIRGPDNENWQSVTYTVAWPSDNTTLFAQPPAIHSTALQLGDDNMLVISQQKDAFGQIRLTVRAVDSGGTLRGGIDESVDFFIDIVILPVNDPPGVVFGSGANFSNGVITILEDTPTTTNGFILRFYGGGSPDSTYENSQVVDVISSGPQQGQLVSTVQVFADGTVTINPLLNANGQTTGWVQLRDNGGLSNGGQDTSRITFTINITPVNDAPSFNVIQQTVTVKEDCGLVTINDVIAQAIAGPPDEASQDLFFRVLVEGVTADQPITSIFTVAPDIPDAAIGSLRFEPTADYFGNVRLSIQLCDSGGNDNGGINCSPFQVVNIVIVGVNDIPTFTPGPPIITTSLSQGQYTSSWATNIRGGPANERQDQSVVFVISSLSNPSLFSTGGSPAISNTGQLTFTQSGTTAGNSTMLVMLRDDLGTDTPPYRVTIQVLDDVNPPLVAILDSPFDDFNRINFANDVARNLQIDSTCIIVLDVQPSTVRVRFRFSETCTTANPDVSNQFLSTAAQVPPSQLATDLRVISSFKDNGNPPAAGPAGNPITVASPASGDDTLVYVLIAVGVVLVLLVIAIVFCIRRWLKKKRELAAAEEASIERHSVGYGPSGPGFARYPAGSIQSYFPGDAPAGMVDGPTIDPDVPRLGQGYHAERGQTEEFPGSAHRTVNLLQDSQEMKQFSSQSSSLTTGVPSSKSDNNNSVYSAVSHRNSSENPIDMMFGQPVVHTVGTGIVDKNASTAVLANQQFSESNQDQQRDTIVEEDDGDEEEEEEIIIP